MTIKDCMDEAVAAGEMDAARASEAKTIFDEIEQEFLDELGPEGARIRAAQETLEQTRRETAIRRRQELLKARTHQRILADMKFAEQRFGVDKSEIAIGNLDSTGIAGMQGAEQVRHAIRGRAHARLEKALEKFRRTLLGNSRDKATQTDMLREAFGENSGNGAAREMADAWYETSEFLRRQFNAFGGHIPKLERWGMPQSHDVVKIRNASYQEWRDFILPKLDRGRMVDGVSGRAFSDQKLELALRDVWETLRTEGFSKVTPGGNAGKAIGNRRADPRFLHFSSADDWLTYQERFGEADLFSTMNAHIDGMARDIAAMQTLGPNPQATVSWLSDVLKKDAAELQGSGAKVEKRRNRLNRTSESLQILYDNYTGSVNQPIDGKVARVFTGLRGILTAAQLGAATLSALSDVAFGRMAAAHAGLPQAKLLKRHLSLLNPASIEDQKLAVRLGLIAENWSQVAMAQARYTGEVAGPETVRRISDGVLRATGLSHWTQSGKWAFGMEFMGLLADKAAVKFDDLPVPLRKTLENHRIDRSSWDLIRATDIFEPERGGFIRPDDIAARADLAPETREDLATRLLTMIQEETEFAVPSTSLRGRSTLGGGTRPGSVPGELLRSALMYKNFAITMYFTHLRRMANQQGTYNKFRYGAALFTSATLMGALSVQLKEMSRGKDPRPMFGEHAAGFWTQALTQGGGLGIFGDFALQDVNRFGRGFEQTVAGPVINFGTDAFKLTAGNLREVLAGDKTNAGAELVRFAKRYTPGASAWYARLIFERAIFDQIQLAIDPGAKARFQRTEKRINRELGQSFFARPGSAPSRLPDLNNALGR